MDCESRECPVTDPSPGSRKSADGAKSGVHCGRRSHQLVGGGHMWSFLTSRWGTRIDFGGDWSRRDGARTGPEMSGVGQTIRDDHGDSGRHAGACRSLPSMIITAGCVHVRHVGRSGHVDRDLRSGSAVGLHFLTGNSDQRDHSRPIKINNRRTTGAFRVSRSTTGGDAALEGEGRPEALPLSPASRGSRGSQSRVDSPASPSRSLRRDAKRP